MQDVAAGEASEQAVGGGEGGLGVDVVEDQQPGGIGVEPVQHGFEPHGFLGCRGGGQAKRGGQGGEGGVQFVRGLGVQEEQGGVVVAVRPGILHGGSGFADAAHAVHRSAGDRGGAAVGAGEAGVQAVQEGLAAFEQGADGGIVEVDGFRGQFSAGRRARLQRTRWQR